MSYRVIERFRKRKEDISTFVRISATSFINKDYPQNLIYGNSLYHSKEGNGTYVMLVFRYPIYADKLVTVSAENRDPRYWVFEGSNDGINFVELKKNDGNSFCGTWGAFDGYNQGCTSKVLMTHELKNKGYYTMFRFMNYGPSSNGEYYVVLTQLDIIGRIDTRCYFSTYQVKKHACNCAFAAICMLSLR